MVIFSSCNSTFSEPYWNMKPLHFYLGLHTNHSHCDVFMADFLDRNGHWKSGGSEHLMTYKPLYFNLVLYPHNCNFRLPLECCLC